MHRIHETVTGKENLQRERALEIYRAFSLNLCLSIDQVMCWENYPVRERTARKEQLQQGEIR